jgi:hypothetical protein
MNRNILTCLALASITSIAAAQEGVTPAPAQGKPIHAAARIAKSQDKVELSLPVEGLTADNAEKVKTMLGSLKAESYVCSGCEAAFAHKGDCPDCKVALTEAKEPVLQTITPSVEKNQIALQTYPGMELHLSQIERALKASSIEIDNSKLAISGHAMLAVNAKSDAASIKTLQTAFQTGKVFERVTITPGTEGMIHIDAVAGSQAPTMAHNTTLLPRVDTVAKLMDVDCNSGANSNDVGFATN